MARSPWGGYTQSGHASAAFAYGGGGIRGVVNDTDIGSFFTPKRLGEGQFYLMVIDDKAGQPFDGSKTYRLVVPPDAPVRQYWSATVYDRKTNALIREMSHTGRSSQSPGLQVNADGSVNLYFEPKAPTGKEANRTPTDPAGMFKVLFRF
ncbi:DUF1214 domain-containing protein [Rhizobiaceae bacterium n13]|uniref:DUF1214 domain-containing protein n=1 Tax=Ferirhizobium litorale TaxID=2927786 RepID=A0AAE3QJA7_9HYPH|nr:DUF1214 domain-containing protein [Fererhizobium litorale]MDI7863939.1 DUF1214 domain-containing protein [Fererhizobium litorale]MDI7924229.1 DUF1214 domain-containing protein [Fererhizobium litorale]